MTGPRGWIYTTSRDMTLETRWTCTSRSITDRPKYFSSTSGSLVGWWTRISPSSRFSVYTLGDAGPGSNATAHSNAVRHDVDNRSQTVAPRIVDIELCPQQTVCHAQVSSATIGMMTHLSSACGLQGSTSSNRCEPRLPSLPTHGFDQCDHRSRLRTRH
jgi:hypothetical protein